MVNNSPLLYTNKREKTLLISHILISEPLPSIVEITTILPEDDWEGRPTDMSSHLSVRANQKYLHGLFLETAFRNAFALPAHL